MMQPFDHLPFAVLPSPCSGAALGGLRCVPVTGDAMRPSFREGDMVGVVPVAGFTCDGLYVVDFAGNPSVCRCFSDLRGGIVVSYDNKLYPEQPMSTVEFEEIVLGQVAVTWNVINKALLN